jgi:hypothetical protein
MPRMQDLDYEISSLRCNLQLNGYHRSFIDLVINLKGNSPPKKKEVKPPGSVYIPCVKGVSEKFKHIRNWYNIRTIFRTVHTPRSSLMRTRPERDSQQRAQCL